MGKEVWMKTRDWSDRKVWQLLEKTPKGERSNWMISLAKVKGKWRVTSSPKKEYRKHDREVREFSSKDSALNFVSQIKKKQQK